MGEEILNKKQIAFLEAIKTSLLAKDFYLTGGTALTAFYLHHRKSEDLDFFSETEIDLLAIETFLKSKKRELGFITFDLEQSFNRNLFFLHFKKEVLKTEFTYFPFTRIEKGGRYGQLTIDSLKDIAVNKVFTIYQQTRARDFIDLYFILKKEKWLLQELIKNVRLKFDTHIDFIQLGSQFIKVKNLKDFPRMEIKLNIEKFQFFFLKIAADLRDKIIR